MTFLRGLAVAAMGGFAFMLVATFLVILGDDDEAEAAAVELRDDSVPAEVKPWLEKAAATCPQIPVTILAAQLEAESGFNARATSPVGAQGIAQFMPGTWTAYGEDADGNGTTSPWDIGDAVMAQARYMCEIAKQVADAGHEGEELLKLTVGGYNAGEYAVLSCDCLPYSETRNYVDKILSSAANFGGLGAMAGGGAGSGDCAQPIHGEYTLSARFGQTGSAWVLGYHTGLDYAAPVGTPVHPLRAGTVTAAGWSGAYGNRVVIDHGDGHSSTYNHLVKAAPAVGATVTITDSIGVVGMTGNTFGPHLHLEVRKGDPKADRQEAAIDPADYLTKCGNNPDKPLTVDQVQASDTTVTEADAAGAPDVAAAALAYRGTPYVLGGGDYSGPTNGGLDCSGLTSAAWYQGTDGSVRLPRTSQEQAKTVTKIGRIQLVPGDLAFFQTGSSAAGSGWNHVGVYIGGGRMVHAPNPSKPVEVVSITDGYYATTTSFYGRPQH